MCRKQSTGYCSSDMASLLQSALQAGGASLSCTETPADLWPSQLCTQAAKGVVKELGSRPGQHLKEPAQREHSCATTASANLRAAYLPYPAFILRIAKQIFGISNAVKIPASKHGTAS